MGAGGNGIGFQRPIRIAADDALTAGPLHSGNGVLADEAEIVVAQDVDVLAHGSIIRSGTA